MPTRPSWIAYCLVLVLASGCAAAAARGAETLPSATPAPPEVTSTAPATATLTPSLAPPTQTPTPAPTDTPRPTQTPKPTSTTDDYGMEPLPSETARPVSPPGSSNFAPAAASIWNTAIEGTDNSSGTCAGTITPPYGLVLLTPAGDTLALHNTVPEDYSLTRASANVYQYAGATNAGDGTLMLTVKFTSATAFAMTRAFTSNAEPACTHSHTLAGTFQYNR